jgi:hypothetical protein
MKVFTCITEVRGSIHLTQHAASRPEDALRQHIAALPFDDGAGPFGEELKWLLRVGSGAQQVQLVPVGHCKNTWLWLDGSRYQPQYLSYIVETDVRESA